MTNGYKYFYNQVLEEAGLCVIKESIKEFGMVHRIQKGDVEEGFAR